MQTRFYIWVLAAFIALVFCEKLYSAGAEKNWPELRSGYVDPRPRPFENCNREHKERISNASMVFLGKLERREKNFEKKVYLNYFSVKKMLKGAPKSEVVVESFPESDPCSAKMKVGDERYVIAKGEPAFMGCCAGTSGYLYYRDEKALKKLENRVQEYLK